MPDPILESWFNGIELGDVQNVIENIKSAEQKAKADKEKMLKIAGSIVELAETDGWKAMWEKIEELKRYFVRTPEDYYQNKDMTGIDAGARAALTLLTNWVNAQHKIIEKYASRRDEQPGA